MKKASAVADEITKVESTAGDAEKLKRPYNEVYRLVEELSDVVDRESLSHWFQTPNEMFDGLKPVEIIERGEIDRLWNMVFQLRSGMPGLANAIASIVNPKDARVATGVDWGFS